MIYVPLQTVTPTQQHREAIRRDETLKTRSCCLSTSKLRYSTVWNILDDLYHQPQRNTHMCRLLCICSLKTESDTKGKIDEFADEIDLWRRLLQSIKKQVQAATSSGPEQLFSENRQVQVIGICCSR